MLCIDVLIFVKFTAWGIVVGGIEPRPKSLEVLWFGFVKALAKKNLIMLLLPDSFTYTKEVPPHCSR